MSTKPILYKNKIEKTNIEATKTAATLQSTNESKTENHIHV